jgi:hypothetical protein
MGTPDTGTPESGRKLCALVDIATIDFKGFFDLLQSLAKN